MRIREYRTRIVRFGSGAWWASVALLCAVCLGCFASVASDVRVSETPSASKSAPAKSELPTVVLISLDGTRPADVTQQTMPRLFEMGERGLRADGLVPVDPTNTFPSHVSLVTGVRPETHRLVNNSFIDRDRGRFKRDAPHSWIESEPLWSIAERNGIRAAAYYWVGSEGPWSDGPGPSETRVFSSKTLEKRKVDRILKWLATPDLSKRPRLITSWFHGADHASHVAGPDDAAVRESLAPQDREIDRLIREMDERGLFETTTLIFVSDHGMVEAARRIDLGRELGKAGLRPSVLGVGGFSMLSFSDKIRTANRLQSAVRVARELGLEAWLRKEAPKDWHVDDPRFGDVVVRAPIGTAIVTQWTRLEGFHGYDAREPAMHGVLLARGRGVVPGTKLGLVSSLAIAPTVLTLLGIPIPVQMKEPPIGALLSGIEPAQTLRPEVPGP